MQGGRQAGAALRLCGGAAFCTSGKELARSRRLGFRPLPLAAASSAWERRPAQQPPPLRPPPSTRQACGVLRYPHPAAHAFGWAPPLRVLRSGTRLLLVKPADHSNQPIDLAKVRGFLERKEAARQADLDRRFETAQRDFARIVEHVVRRYAPLRIYQWGSLLDRGRFSGISDIDIALEGLKGPEEYFAILGDAEAMSDLPVDVIELEKVPATTAEAIRTEGRLVHERAREG